jgi:hypothetical protein
MSHHVNIPSLFKACAERTFEALDMSGFFDYGHYDAVNKNLVSKSQAITDKIRYPLVWLVTPYAEKRDPRQDYYCELSGLDILILTNSLESESIETRVTKYFEPLLWPIWEELKNQLYRSGFFQILSPDAIAHDEVKDWFYQSGLQGKANLFNDYIDAVQIKNIRLRVNETVTQGKILH